MKRHLLLLLTVVTLLWSNSSHAAGPPGSLGEGDGANSNPHNLSSLSGNNAYEALTETQICIFCHTPHGATPQSTLWGRPDPLGPNSNGTFPILTNPTLGISYPSVVGYSLYDSASSDYPNGASKLCLSCHDGVTAMGILANGSEIDMTGSGLVTAVIDLSKSHPISFVYDSINVVPLLVGLGKSLRSPTADYLDWNNRVQCTSCHQPHQNTMGTGGNGLPFWRVNTGVYADDYATVCDACHTAPPSLSTGHGYP